MGNVDAIAHVVECTAFDDAPATPFIAVVEVQPISSRYQLRPSVTSQFLPWPEMSTFDVTQVLWNRGADEHVGATTGCPLDLHIASQVSHLGRPFFAAISDHGRV